MTDPQAPNPRAKVLDWAAAELGLDERTIRLEVIRMVMRQDLQQVRPLEMVQTLTHFILTGERSPQARPTVDTALGSPFTDAQEARIAAVTREIVTQVLAGADARIRTAIESIGTTELDETVAGHATHGAPAGKAVR